jgi:hypothetical protein
MKNILLIASILLTTFYTFAQTPTNGLVAYYTFDGNAQDASGNGNHGILYNCVPYLDRSGNPSSNSVSFILPANFAGNTFSTYNPNVGSGIVIENSSSLIISNQFSFSFWLKQQNVPTTSSIFTKTNGNDGFGNGAGMGVGVGMNFLNTPFGDRFVNFSTGNNGSSFGYYGYAGPGIYRFFEWFHMVVTYDGTTIKMFYNNQLVSSQSYNIDVNTINDKKLIIGGILKQSTQTLLKNVSFQGSIDDFRVYNRALTDMEIKGLYYEESCKTNSTVRDVKATPATNQSFDATWLQNLSNVNYYQYRFKKINETNWSAISNHTNPNFFGVQNLQQGQSYHYQIKAVCANGQQTNWFTSPTATLSIKRPRLSSDLAIRSFKIEQGSANIQVSPWDCTPNNKIRIKIRGTSGFTQDYVVTANTSGNATQSVPTTQMTSGDYTVNIQDEGPASAPYSTPISGSEIISFKVSEPPIVSKIDITSAFYVDGANQFKVNWKDFIERGTPYAAENVNTGIRTGSYRIELGKEVSPNNISWLTSNTLTFSDRVLQTKEFSFTIPQSTAPTAGKYFIRITDLVKPTSTKTSNAINYSSNALFTTSRIYADEFTPPTSGLNFDFINGITADGTARFFIRINRNSTFITKVRIELYDENYSQTGGKSILGKLMVKSNGVNGYNTEANNATAINLDNTTLENNNFWFWYVAPDDFYQNSTHQFADKREVKIKVIAYDNANTILGENESVLSIVRPPLMLVHGLGGDGDTNLEGKGTWEKFAYDFSGTEKKFNVLGLHKAISIPQMSGDGSFKTNADKLIEGELQKPINEMRRNGYVCSKVDYVAHSMGGCMLRAAIDRTNEFYDEKNYGLGYVNKFITLTTPHNGSPLGDVVQELAGYSNNLNTWALEDKLTTFFSYTGSYIQSASEAVSNMAIKQSNGGIRFRAVNGQKTHSHVIVSDIVQPNSREQTINTFNSISPIANITDGIVAFNLMADIIFKGAMRKAKLLSDVNLETNLESIKKRTDGGIEELIQTSIETIDFLNYYSGVAATSTYNNYLFDSDIIVPLNSQLAGLSLNSSNVTQNVNSAYSNYLNYSASHNFSPNKITWNKVAGNRVLELLNTPIISNRFGNLPAGVTVQSKTEELNKNETSLSSVTLPMIKTLRNTNIAKIVSPSSGSVTNLGDTFEIKTEVLDTTNQIYSNLYFSEKIIPLSKTNSNTTNIATSNNEIGKKIIYFESMYKFGNDSLVTYWDSTSININSIVAPNTISTNSQSITIFKGDTLNTILNLTYPNYTAYLDSRQLGITAISSDPSVLKINPSNNDLIGVSTGYASVIYTYAGVTTKLFVEVLYDDKNCPYLLSHNSLSLSSGAYKASSYITSTTNINTGTSYQAGNAISLLPPFQAGANETFSATIESCLTIPTDGQIAYYGFDGNTNDSSGNNNNLISNGTTTLVADRKNQVMKASGYGGNTNVGYQSALNSTSLQFTTGFSISLWYKLPSYEGMDGYRRQNINGYQIFVAKEGDRSGFYIGVSNDIANNKQAINFTNNPSSGVNNFNIIANPDGTSSSNLNKWIHLVVTAGNGNVKIFIDGILKNTASVSNFDFTGMNSKNLYLGTMQALGTYWYPYSGALDEARIYNRALTSVEVLQIYNAEKP